MLVFILFIHMICFFAHWTAAATNEFSRNTQSWQCSQLCTTSNENKLETVNNLISFKANLHYS